MINMQTYLLNQKQQVRMPGSRQIGNRTLFNKSGEF